MTISFLKKSALTAAALSATMLSGAAQAGHDSGLTGWAQDAGNSIDEVMTYPAKAVSSGDQGWARFRVTVNRAGDVIASDLLEATDSVRLNAAARRALARADLPALPASYDGEKLTFALQLNYVIASSAREQRQLMREGRVTGREVAEIGAPMMASITMLDQAAE